MYHHFATCESSSHIPSPSFVVPRQPPKAPHHRPLLSDALSSATPASVRWLVLATAPVLGHLP
jgi:hypothetical protein